MKLRIALVSIGVFAASALGVRYGTIAIWNHHVNGYEHGKALY